MKVISCPRQPSSLGLFLEVRYERNKRNCRVLDKFTFFGKLQKIRRTLLQAATRGEKMERELNSVGCILLCQELITSAIKDNDRTFFTSELGKIAQELAVRKNNYNITSIISKATHLPATNAVKYDTDKLAEEVKYFSIDTLSEIYHTSIKSMRSALAKRHISWGKNVQHDPSELCFI